MIFIIKKLLKKVLPAFLINTYHLILTFFGAAFFGFPSRDLKVIGVTGTNGKSTTVEFITKILEEAGFRVASISSIKFKIGKKEWPNLLKMTMPEGFLIQKFLRKAKKEKCDYMVLEVTSQGIIQHRHRFIKFDVALITNLLPEHIEAHKGFENYKKAKGKLFEVTKNIHIVNLDDKNAEYFLQFPAKKKYGFGLETSRKNEEEKTSDKVDEVVKAESLVESQDGVSFFLKGSKIHLKLLGKFNVYNALAAIACALSQGIDMETCKKGLEKINNIPGRMEIVVEDPFWVIIDYAVVPESLEEVYREIQTLFSPNRMICVFGACGGGRDRQKRPKLGRIASRYCQEIILTNEDPYDEDPEKILQEIEEGIEDKTKVTKILDRRKAIREALKRAKEKDVIVLTGKGCEPWICLAQGKKIPWDERKVVKEELQRVRENQEPRAKSQERTKNQKPRTEKEKFFEVLPHKADLKLKVFGSSKKELFLNTMRAMFEVAGVQAANQITKREIKIQSPEITQLLVDFLSEVLYLSEVNNEMYFDLRFYHFNDTSLEGELIGKKILKKDMVIKGVTYHDLEIKQKGENDFEATILFDV